MEFSVEIIDDSNKAFLEEMMFEAIFVPEHEKPLPRNIIEDPLIAKYIEHWGRKGDFGITALVDGHRVGAVWIRYFSANNKAFGFIDEGIPEMSMAVIPACRNRGLGTRLLKEFLRMSRDRGIRSISLSVDKRNRAANLYKRLGFALWDENKDDYIMKIEI